MTTYKELVHELQAACPSERTSRMLRESLDNGTARGAALVDAAMLHQLNSRYRIFKDKRIWADVLDAASRIRQHAGLLGKTDLLHQVFQQQDLAEQKALADRIVASLSGAADQATALASDFAPLFALLPFVPGMAAHLRQRNLPEDIILDTLDEFEGKVKDFQARHGRPGIRTYISWLRKFTGLEIIRVGRFNFEMKKAFAGPVAVYRNRTGDCRMLLDRAVLHHSGRLLGSAGCTDEEGAFQGEIRETADDYEGFPVGANGLALNRPIRLAKNEWQRVLAAGDPVLSVHIPAGMSLAHEVCEASYTRARIIFAAHFPEFAFKAFCCESWMMDPQLAALLGQETNITRFQNKYWPYPTRSQGRAVADFVFLKDWAAGIADWPEDTRLRSAIKNHYLAGRFVYESGGVFF